VKKQRRQEKPRVKFIDVIRAVQEQRITQEEQEELFEVDPDNSQAFRPIFRINTDLVDIDGLELVAAASGHALALTAQEVNQRRLLDRTTTKKALAIDYLAEGDSWFSHPLVTTVIDALMARRYRIKNLAKAGDTIEGTLQKKEYMSHLGSGTIKAFLFSGGGNDVLGDLTRIISLYNPSYDNPKNPAHVNYYIDSSFTLILRFLELKFQELLKDIQSVSPQTLLLVHGYSHARPFANGVYIGKYFEYLGFDLLIPKQKSLAWAIVAELVDRFNRVLKTFASNHSRAVKYVDFRGTVLQSDNRDWFDYELHPSKRAANKMADLYERALPIVSIREVA
jgi:hypothetical protein